MLALHAIFGLGCTAVPRIVQDPELQSFEAAPLSRWLTVATEEPTLLRVRATAGDQGFEVRWPEARTAHAVPLLGFKPDRAWQIEVFVDDGRSEGRAATLQVVTEPLPDDFGVVEVGVWEPEAMEPGYRLATVRRVTEEGRHFLAAWDVEDLEIAWYSVSEVNFGDVRRTARGTLLGLRGIPEETDFLMRTLRRWTPEVMAPNDVLLPVPGAHHELYPLPDGSMLTLSRYAHDSAAYPVSVETPDVKAPARLVASRVIRFDRDGGLLWDVPLGDLLDDGRISMSSLDRESFGYDWLHANAVIPDPDGGVVVSVRHQDALVKISDAGELEWILGDPAGWGPDHADRLLEPVGDVVWPYHPHAPAWAADGTLVVFDNHNFGHTPYTDPPAEPWASRVVAYRIDAVAGTVAQAWAYVPPGPPLQSPRMGDADPLPITGHVLANFGWIEEGARDEAGIPESVSMRLVEFDPTTGERALDLWVRAPDDGGADGVRSYRSEALPSLYADDVAFTRF